MRHSLHDLIDALDRGRRFVAHDIWHIGQPGEPVPRGFIIRHIRVAILLVQGLIKDNLLLRASALTFATTLAIVPFMALMFFMIKTFNLGDTISELVPIVSKSSGAVGAMKNEDVWNEFIHLLFQGMDATPSAARSDTGGSSGTADTAVTPNTPQQVAGQSPVANVSTADTPHPSVENSTGNHSPPTPMDNPVVMIRRFAEQGSSKGTITSASVIFVLATVLGLMMNIEGSFNIIWGIQRRRSWYRMISNYVMFLLLLPFLVAGVLFLTTILGTVHLAQKLGGFTIILRSLQYVIIWLAFTALYYGVPNTRTKLRYAFLAGVVAGTFWCLLSWMYVQFQFGLARYTLLYNVGAQIPVFLMWAYFSWLIVLFGAELSFAYQNEKTFAMERWAEGASYAYREALGLWAMIELGRRFDRGEAGLSAETAATAWNVPARLVNETFRQLEEGHLVVQCASKPPSYQPSRSLDKITAADVVRCLRESGRDPSALRKAPTCQMLNAKLYPWIAAPRADLSVSDLIRELAVETASNAVPTNILPLDTTAD